MGVVASLAVRITADVKDFAREISQLDNLGSMGKAVGDVAGAFSSLQGVLGTLGVGKMVDEFLDFSSQLSDINSKTGISVRELQRLEYAGSLVGLSLDNVSSSASMLQKRLGAGGEGVQSAVEDLGLNFEQLRAMDPGEQFTIVARELGKVTDQTQLAALATELFGKSGTTLIPLFKENLKELGDEAERLGLILSDKTVKAADDLGDNFTKLQHAGMQLVADFLRPFLKVQQEITDPGELARWEKLKQALFVDKLVTGWELLTDAISQAAGMADEFGTPKTPPHPKGFGKDIVLAGSGMTKERTKEMSAAESELNRDLKQKQAEAKRLAEAWQDVNDKMSGKAAIKAAEDWMKHVDQIGGVTKLSADEQRRGNDILGQAYEAYARLGGTASKHMDDIYMATLRVVNLGPKMTSGLQNLVDVNGKLQVGKDVGYPFTPAMIPNIGVTSGLGGLNLPGGFSPTAGFKPASFMEQLFSGFGSTKTFGTDIAKTMMGALTGGGNVGKAVGGMLGGNIFGSLAGSLAGKLGSAGISGLIGGALGSVIPGIGTMIGSMLGPLVSKFGGFFTKLFGRGDDADKERDAFTKMQGGFDSLAKKLHEVGTEGDRMFAALQGAKNGAQAKAAIDNITAALEKQKQAIDNAMSALPSGVNARSQNITSQADFSVVGAEAIGTFAFLIQQGQSAIQAFTAITPAVQAMSAAFATGNFEMTGAAQQLMNLNAIVTANKVQFDNLSASGTILTAMLQANIQNGQLFAAVASDIGTQVQAVIDRGVPMEQVFALAQPQLQALWEAQNKWHFELDATTQSLLDQAAAQGFVGEAMKGVQQQILDVLTRIAEFMGALPAQAQTAAAGMNAAFGGLRAPDLGGIMSRDQAAAIFKDAQAQMGGPNVAEPYVAGGGGQAVQLNVDGRALAEVMVPRITEEVNRIVG